MTAWTFLRDERGSISIEFMLLLPMLFFMLGLTYVFWDAYRSNSQTAKVAYTMTDLISRVDVAVSDADIDALFDVQQKLLRPDLARQTMRITSICFKDDTYQVLWSEVRVGDDLIDLGIDFDLPLALTNDTIPLSIMPRLADDDMVLLVEVEALWTPLFADFGIGRQIWTNRLVSRPRFVEFIPFDPGDGEDEIGQICPEVVG